VCSNASDFAWLGETIGNNTSLESVMLRGDNELGAAIQMFADGFKRNASILRLSLKDSVLSEGAAYETLMAFQTIAAI